MARPFAKGFYSSRAWQSCRDSYIAERMMIDGGMCEVCHKELGYIVHHKVPITENNINDPMVTLSHDNLSYECRACHDEHEGHGLNKKVGLLCCFDDNGEPYPP